MASNGEFVYPTSLFTNVPEEPGIYAFYQNYPRASAPCAYVGSSGTLRTRIKHHLCLQISTVGSKGKAVSLNIDQLTDLNYWTHEKFSEKKYLHAAEFLLMDLANPLYRAESNIILEAKNLLDKNHPDYDGIFIEEMQTFLQNASGTVALPSMVVMHNRITELEKRMALIEKLFESTE